MIVIRLFSKNIPTIDELKLPELFKELVKKHS
jgi:Tfp pilus assembly ATPase PilU